MKALSIRQPWAWLIANGFKDIENRSWPTGRRGTILIHASKAMTEDDYLTAFIIAHENNVLLPAFDDLQRGGIIGQVDITDCVTTSTSPWFYGPCGFVLANAKSLPFQPCRGHLSFFEPQI